MECAKSTARRILIVEDDAIISIRLESILTTLGYDVIGFIACGEEVLQKVVELPPDLVLMDIHLAGDMNGIEVAAQIHARFDIPVVYLTAYSDGALLQEAKITEPYGYLVKPVRERELHATIEMALYRHRAEEELGKYRDHLEQLVEERTVELTRANEQLQREIAERKQAEDALRQRELMYKLVLEGSNMGTWDRDIQTGEVIRNERAAQIYGYTLAEMEANYDWWASRIHPDDKPKVIEERERHMRGEIDRFTAEYRLKHRSGEWIWALSIGKVVEYDEIGKPARISGVILNITERKKAEEELARERNLLRILIDHLPDNIFVKDTEGRFLLNNVTSMRLLGAKNQNELLGKTDFDFMPHELAAQYRNVELEFLESGQPVIEKEVFYPQRKKRQWVSDTRIPLRNEHGELIGFVGVGRDITERKQSEEALRESEAQKNAILNGITAGIAFVNKNLEVLWLNKAAARELNKPLEYIIGRKCHEAWAGSEKPCENCPTVKASKTGKAERFIMVSSDGNVRDERGEPVFDAEGNLIGIVSITNDITEQKRAEEGLKESEERYRSLVAASPDAITLTDLNANIIMANQQAALIHGFESVEEMLSSPINALDLIAEEDHQRAIDNTRKTLETGIVRNVEYTLLRKDGVSFPGELSASLIMDADSQPKAFTAVTRDITERKQAEEALRGSEEQLSIITDEIPALIAYVDSGQRYLHVNKHYAEWYGTSKEELIGKKVRDVLDETVYQNAVKYIQAALKGQYVSFENIAYDKNGRKRFVNAAYVPYFDDEGFVKAFVASVQDITERKQMEEALRESEERFRSIVEQSNDGIVLTDWNGNVIEWNEGQELITGVKREDVIGRPIWDCIFRVMPEKIRHLERKEQIKAAFIELSETGKSIWANRLSEPVIQRPDGTLHIAQVMTFPIKTDKGFMVGSISRDITEQKKAAEQIKASLEEKEVMLKEIHHRVKNNLQVVSGLLGLQLDYVQDKQTVEGLNESRDRIMSMALIHEYLYQSEDLARIDFNEYIRNLTGYLSQSYEGRAITLNINVDDDILLDVDTAVPCGLIISELFSNSIKHAFPEGKEGEIKITIHSISDEIELVLSDSGVGIPEDLDIRNTESLGLQLVVALVDQLDGTIELDRSSGTAFKIKFRAKNEVS